MLHSCRYKNAMSLGHLIANLKQFEKKLVLKIVKKSRFFHILRWSLVAMVTEMQVSMLATERQLSSIHACQVWIRCLTQ